MDSKKVIGIVLLLLLFAGGWYFLTQQTIPAPGISEATPEPGASNGTGTNTGKINVGLSSRGLASKTDTEITTMLEDTRNKVNTMSDQLGTAVRTGNMDKGSPQYKDVNMQLTNLQNDFKMLQAEAIKRGLAIS